MIRIQKSALAPARLTTEGAAHRADMERAYDKDPDACLAPKSTLLEAQQGIYGHRTVKKALKDDQYDKCCYCERDFTANYHGDVEHFRPKGGYQQVYNGSLEQPGYYWLAYDWENLYFSCALCNQTHKGNYFPLSNHPAGRADGHLRDTTAEQALLPDLAREDPEVYLNFNHDIVEARLIGGQPSVRGQACITAFGLDRVGLTGKRYDFLEQLLNDCTLASFDFSDLDTGDPESQRLILRLVRLHETVDEFIERVEKARLRVALAAQDSAEFAGMVRAYIRQHPRYASFIKPPTAALAATAWKRTYQLPS
jgi:uncharacterized protein (TIGR02646 family)